MVIDSVVVMVVVRIEMRVNIVVTELKRLVMIDSVTVIMTMMISSVRTTLAIINAFQ